MRYSNDLRIRVLTFPEEGGTKAEASRRFSVGRTTIYAWLQEPKIRRKISRLGRGIKLDRQALIADVQAYPDTLLKEYAQRFGVSINTVSHALKILKSRRKKKFRVSGMG